MILQSHLNNLIKITGDSFFLSSLYFSPVRNATKKAGGSVKNGRDSIGKRLGLKKSPGQRVIAGNIIIRQRGLTYAPSDDKSVGLGRDYTIYALNPGYVKFSYDLKKKRNIVSVIDIYPYKTSPKIILKQKLEKERKENAKSEYEKLENDFLIR